MKTEIEEKIKLKAHFVIGANSYERDDDDPIMLSAIDDALEFLRSLPEKYQEPNWIKAATTESPEDILHLAWFNFSVGWHQVEIYFQGNGKCVVGWNNPDRTGSGTTVASLDELKALDIPSKIENLKNIRPALPGEKPL